MIWKDNETLQVWFFCKIKSNKRKDSWLSVIFLAHDRFEVLFRGHIVYCGATASKKRLILWFQVFMLNIRWIFGHFSLGCRSCSGLGRWPRPTGHFPGCIVRQEHNQVLYLLVTAVCLKDFHLGTNHELVMWHNSLQHHRGDQSGDRLEFSVTCRSATPVMFRLGFYDHDHHLFLFFPVIFDSSASFSRYPAATDTSTSLQVVTPALVSTTRQGYD